MIFANGDFFFFVLSTQVVSVHVFMNLHSWLQDAGDF